MDTMNIVILADGTIRSETSPISPINHASAETFFKEIAALTGGEVRRQHRGHGHKHQHHHQEQHNK